MTKTTDEVTKLRHQNKVLRSYVEAMNAVIQEQSSFTLGIIVCELIDNPSENKAYDKAAWCLGQWGNRAQLIMRSEEMK